ncbi:hypothetical protein OGM63_25400 [Plectonema radiosum NIES-515]|uniref:Transposase n=1 Tax=Plectonema radiosum NIES-515 TaxID=2986073 RepID=A0ABT3B5Z8_9CYAN|nr:hypothetical protein [Plectonema radiosum]MCV3216801.1 hypothetical protein [Plectonema radiosum NIES-515]
MINLYRGCSWLRLFDGLAQSAIKIIIGMMRAIACAEIFKAEK